MNKEIFIRTVNLILFTFFFSAWKANKEKRKKDREGYYNRSVRNINLLFNSSCSEFIYDKLIIMIAVARWPMLVFDLPARHEENSGDP